jgi:ligand-binding sensor domain-containing protein/signal transduction histidine kinase
MFKYISTAYLFILAACFYGQQIRFERITNKEGLSQNSVTSICQDSSGFMWFGTYSGLNRYDGYNYKVFKNEQDNSNSLGNDFIRALCVDKSGDLWIGTNGGGLNKYNKKKECFIRYQLDPNNPNSISHNSITSLFVDHTGDLWIGTFGGGINKVILSKDLKNKNKNYNNNSDKLKFIHYNHNDVKVKNSFWDFINSFYEDRYGVIWIGTRNGLSKYDPVANKFTNYFHLEGNNTTLSSSSVSSICEDKLGNLWVGTWDLGLNIYDRDNDKFIPFPYKDGNNKINRNESIFYLYKDKSNDLWIGTFGRGLGRLSLNNATEDNKRHYFDIVYYQNDPYNLNSLSTNNVYTLFEDKSGVLWIGTDWGGLNKFDKMKSNMVCYSSSPADPQGLNQKVIFTIHKDQNDVLWLGTRSGGINLFDLHTKKFSYFRNNQNDINSLMSDIVLTIYEDRNHKILIGTANGLNEFVPAKNSFIPYIIQPDDPASTYIFSICEDKLGYLWLGTYGNGIYKFDRKTKKIVNYKYNASDPNSIGDNTIWAIHEDRTGNLWIGTNTGGLNLFDRKNNKFIRYTHNDNNSSISDNKILTIFEDKRGNLWLGTTLGLNKLIRSNDKQSNPSFLHFTKDDGLTSNTIHGILEDDHNNLWISTNFGLSKFNPDTKAIKNFSISDGLQDYEFNANSCYKDEKSGIMYFGGINGLNIFHPDSIKNNLTKPNVVITDFKVFNKSVPINKEINGHIILENSITDSKEIKLNYTDDIFSIEFAALHYSSPENNQYAYKLEGFEKNWNLVYASQRTAVYTNLDPGKYTFIVKASNNDGIWNENPAILEIIITPPFWKTWWFRLTIILFVILLLIIVYKYRTRRILQKNKELEEHIAKRTEELEMTNKELEAFTYSVSHDLRAPLRSMSGFSELMLEDYEETIDEKGKNYLNRINSAAKQMGLLIDDMLKLSKLTRGKMNIQQVDISSIVQSIANDLKQKDPERKAVFNIEKSLTINGDSALINIMMQNLLDNAWKFTSKKSESIIEFGRTLYNNQQVFYLKDNGVGFNNEYVGKIFEVFHRLQNDFEGTGIGLATVRRIVIRHGGNIWAEGKLNEGATFYFTF